MCLHSHFTHIWLRCEILNYLHLENHIVYYLLQFMMLSYVVNFAWMGVTSGMAIPVIFFIMLNQICETEYTYQGVQAADGQALSCFNLTRIGT